MEPLYDEQSELLIVMEKMFINIKKDGQERKMSSTYFKNKLELLEKYWQEYTLNHERLKQHEDKERPYFARQDYKRAKTLYDNIKNYMATEAIAISKAKLSIPTTSNEQGEVAGGSRIVTGTPQKTTAETMVEKEVGQSSFIDVHGSGSKIEEMLHKQAVNFKAFMRTVSSIDIDSVAEKWKFEDILKQLQARWSIIDSLHWEIDSILDGEDEQYELNFTQHEVIYNDLKEKINTKMWSVAHRENITPQIDIPVFTGNYQQWISFKNLFNEVVHVNPALSNSQKMQFLKSKVRGDAERLIQHLQISSENYITCWEILNQRYENKKLIFASYLNIILNIPSMQTQSLTQIKKMYDSTKESLNAIKNIGVDITSWDPIIVHLLSQKLDNDTHADYIESLKQPRELPVLQDFLDYLESKFTMLEQTKRKPDVINQKHGHQMNAVFPKKPQYNTVSNQYNRYRYPNTNHANTRRNVDLSQHSPRPFMKSYHASSPMENCPVCHYNHGIYLCRKFLNKSSVEKLNIVVKMDLCKNCLSHHYGRPCLSQRQCRVCAGNHNTLLHDAFTQREAASSQIVNPSNSNYKHKNGNNRAHVSQGDASEILLATAMIKVKANDGTYKMMRALIDQGSQISIISENGAQQLGLKREQCKGVIFGVGEKENSCKGTINIECASIYDNFTFNTQVFVMNQLIKNLPNASFEKPTWSYINTINLADPEFYIRRPVDLLLGADIYSSIMLEGMIRGETPTQPLAQQSQLGWLLCGAIPSYQCNVILANIDEIRKFWETEEISEAAEISKEDQDCMDYYSKTTKRLPNGRYEVQIPFKKQFENEIGSSKHIAIAQFHNLEAKLTKQPELAESYKEFINEYIRLEHMKLSRSSLEKEVFLPHHAVVRESSSTTKLRVVFNASAKTSTGKSLNDVMYKGPNLQKDLQEVILKWRQYQYAFTADIEKMYRQIMVNETDQRFQKIIWREEPGKELKQFQMTTVTYGCKAAPFLAMRTLRQLATDEGAKFPKAAKVVAESFYMDDLVHGSHSIEEGKQLTADLNQLLKAGGFTLRKWSSNCQELLYNVSNESVEDNIFTFKSEDTSKTLGLQWNSSIDQFTFEFNIEFESTSKMTKRMLLAEISKVFDPLGWLAPVVTKLKLLFQSVWQENLNWDNIIPLQTCQEWNKLKTDMESIKDIKIPRWIGCSSRDIIELHGFCDASSKAYAAVVYARILRESSYLIVLVAAKTKLVPLKRSVSLPRLELCGAQLLAKLMHKVQNCYQQYDIKAYGWCDSMVVLGWLQGDENRWKTFVANRIKYIKTILPADCWNYVKSKENPADAASRGLTFSQLKNHSLWWEGPHWLSQSMDVEPPKIKCTTNLEMKIKVQSNVIIQQEFIIDAILQKHSSINKAIRILAWILRASAKRECRTLPYITVDEFNAAKLRIIRHVQQVEFADDIHNLKRKYNLSSSSRLNNLQPFLCDKELLRVGGRLRNARLPYATTHPIILPNNHRLTSLLIDQAHQLTFHGGPKITLATLRKQYWVLGGNNATKKHLRNCIICRKHNPQLKHQIMGDLPEARCNAAPPFYHTGVDYTGFVDVKCSQGRGIKTTKGYIAVFICMVTKAVHLEIVSDLSSSAFLAALRRMSARRGAPRHIYSDNGTNFVKANRILQEEYEQIGQLFTDNFLKEITEMQIEWHFNAPSWPTAGGLWEKAVASLKFHLKRVVGCQKLTFEEYSTLLAQVEACLNSRPLCALSESPDDIDCLTPAHFLQSRAGNTVIETADDARTRWHLVSKLFNCIWKQWKIEYLTQLTARQKWHKRQENLGIGDLVVIHDDNLPAGKWAMGRVVDVHPGNDGMVRVLTLKTKNGYLKRPITKLSLLPLQEKGKDNTASENIQQTTRKSIGKPYKVKNFISTALTFLLLIFSLITVSSAKFTVSKLDNKNQSLYFDPVTELQFIRDDWTMIAYYNMSTYWEGIKAADKYIQYLQKACTEIENIHCNTILAQLHHDQLELMHYNDVLLSKKPDLSDNSTRRRRGLVNAIGRVANSLFGVLDDRFAEQYEKDIELLRQNNKHMYALWKNQTSVIEGQYNILQRTEDLISKQHKIINQHLNTLGKDINYYNQQMQQLSKIEEFTLTSLTAIQILSNLRRIQDVLLNTLTDIYHGKFNLHLLTPEQFRMELQLISRQLNKDLTLPLPNIDANYRDMYQLLSIKARVTKEYLIFEIKLPLISRDSFQLYKLIPIPHRQNNQMLVVSASTSYVAINLKKDAFVETEKAELEKCLHYKALSLCQLHRPIKHLGNKANFCKTKDQACDFRVTPCENQWYELTDPGTHFFFYCEPYQLRIICEKDMASVVLHQAGLIRLDGNCMAKGLDFTLYAPKHLSNSLSINPDLPAIDIDPINSVLNPTIPPLLAENITGPEFNINSSLTNIRNQIDQMKKDQSLVTDEWSIHDIHQYAVSYAAVGGVAALAIIWWWCRCRVARSPCPSRQPQQRAMELGNTLQCSVLSARDLSSVQTDVQPLEKVHSATSPIVAKRVYVHTDDETVL